MLGTQRVISKHALILMARGKTEIASQVFVYDHIREIRADIETFEVKVLMDYDQNFFRVFKVEVNEHIDKDTAIKMVLDFYNKLLNASMKLSEEERDNLLAQKQAQADKMKEFSKNETTEEK